MEELKELDNIDIEILKYVEGKKVSREFLKRLENDKLLQEQVLSLKDDIYLMDNVDDSKMYNLIKKEASIKIKKNNVEYISGFTFLTPLPSRSKENDKTQIYYFQNVGIVIKNTTTTLNIRHIEKQCKIYKNNKEIVNIKLMNEYSTKLEKGIYKIEIDDVIISLDIE